MQFIYLLIYYLHQLSTLKFRYSLFGAGTNGHDFANVRLGLDGEVIEITFAEEQHREFVKDNPRFA